MVSEHWLDAAPQTGSAGSIRLASPPISGIIRAPVTAARPDRRTAILRMHSTANYVRKYVGTSYSDPERQPTLMPF
jgi:hypothetical protein